MSSGCVSTHHAPSALTARHPAFTLTLTQILLGQMHYRGEGGSVDYPEAARLYGLPGARDYPEAQHSLGLMYYYGEGVPQDYAEARRLSAAAAAQEHVEAMALLGHMYVHGEGGPKDLLGGRRHGLAALATPDSCPHGHAGAQVALATMHHI